MDLLLLLTLISTLINLVIYWAIKKISVILNPKQKKLYYYIVMFFWILLFSSLTYILVKETSIGKAIWELVFLLGLTNPLGIIILLSLGSLLQSLPFEAVVSIALTLLFILGYCQWFIWLPKHLKKKKSENKDLKKDKNKTYGKVIAFDIKTEEEIKEELIKKIKSLIITGYNNKEISRKLENIDDKKINEIRKDLF